MAAITTSTSAAGGLTSFIALFTSPSSLNTVGALDGFNPWPSEAVFIRQRVWDTVNLVWCYFEDIVIDTTPDPAQTSPVHSGSITSHQIVNDESE